MPELTLDQYFRRIFALKQSANFIPWFESYCKPLTDPLRASRQFHFRKYLVELSGIKPDGHKSVLEAGCGFGPNLICFHMMGFRQIHGVDFYGPMVDTMKTYLREIGLDREIIPHQGDVTKLTSQFPENQFDLILSNEALSHYCDVDAFLREALKILKPGGALIISDNNNAANPKIREMNQRIWDAFENGPRGRVYTHTVGEPYIEKRKRIVGEAFPELDPQAIAQIAAGTSLMKKDDVIAAARRYKETGEAPTSYFRPGLCPLEPEKNELMENMFHPIELAKRMTKMGYKARAVAYLGGATRGGAAFQLNKLWQALTPLTVRWSNCFFIIAHK